MTADLTPSLDEKIAAARTDRDALMDMLRIEQPDLAAELDTQQAAREVGVKPGGKSAKYVVLRHLFVAGEVIDQPVSHHRFEWVAELCAWRRTAQHRTEVGGHHTVRRADA